MKLTLTAITGMALCLSLTACGKGHEKVHAVDKLEEAQAAAIAKAPTAETISFKDQGQTPVASTQNASQDTPTEPTNTTAETQTQATSQSDQPEQTPADTANTKNN